jgi:pseudooxynicotine oxidase
MMTDISRPSPPDPDHGAVSRRDFLIGTGAMVAGSALPVTRVHGQESSRDYDVIIVGGGFCGVSAARECRRAGLRTVILEARNRLGGRTCTADFDGRPADLGGTFVHWSQPYVWTEIRRNGLELSDTPGATADRWIVHTSAGDIVTLSFARVGERVDNAVALYMGDSRALLPLPHDPFGSDAYRRVDRISSAERLLALKNRLSPLYRDILDGYMAGQGHNYTEQIAWLEMVRWYALPGHNTTDMDDATGRFRLKGGTGALLNAMLSETHPEVRLGTPVKRIMQDATGVSVQTAAGDEWRGRLVVSTIPLNVLKDVEWQPGLSEAQLLASRLTHAGTGTKLHLLLQGDYGSISCIAPSHLPLNSLETEDVVAGHTHLVGFGPNRELLDVNDIESVQRAVRLFLPDARVVKTFGYEWLLDPYSQGTWCTLRPGMWSQYLRELQQPRGRVIFASADWANGWRGFIDGAIEQGLEAGRRVREMLDGRR